MARKVRIKSKCGCVMRICIALIAVFLLVRGGQFILGTNDYEAKELIDMGYPKSLAKLYVRNEEARDFVLAYDETKGVSNTIDISQDMDDEGIPLFLQWDTRWGYGKYGDDFMGVVGCGPTALSMVYCGLTGDATMNPWEVARLAEEGGYYVNGKGSSWSMMDELAEQMGLDVRNVQFDSNGILTELYMGNPIICIVGPGDFTSEGHFIVLTGADEKGMITVNDPNSKLNSEKKWEVETIIEQTQNLWGYDFE